MHKVRKYSAKRKKKLLEELLRYNKHITKACKAANVSRRTYYMWMEDDSEFAKEVGYIEDELLDESLDDCEDVLREKIREKNLVAVFFHLNNKGQKRGYNVKHEVKDKEPLINITLTKNE